MAMIAHFAVSLDGFSADRDGRPTIIAAPGFDHGVSSHGIPEFMATCDAIVMGRTTFDPAVANPWWPWPNLDVLVLTSRPLPDQEFPSRVTAHASPQGLLDELRERDYAEHVELLGGPSTIAAFLELGAVDRLRVLVVPVLMGSGTPLARDAGAPRPLRLYRQHVYDDGTVALEYMPVR